MRFVLLGLLPLLLLGCGHVIQEQVTEPPPIVLQDVTGLWVVRQVPAIKLARVKTSTTGKDVTIKVHLAPVVLRCETGPPATCRALEITGDWEKSIWPYTVPASGLDAKCLE